MQAFRAGVASRYRIEREVGRGGMATVYLAQDLKHHRAVALKVFRSDLADVLGPGRFQQEIEVAARLNHPNILPLYDSDEAAGSLFYVMPFVEGGTLRDRMAADPPPTVAEAIGIVRQIAAGLAHAHAQGLVHRDIKPGNILLSSGHAFLADFGIAWVVREAVDTQRLTVTGLVLGTPAYMPPEQLATRGRVDQRADQYALACVLYEMLLGQPPERDFRSVSAARRSILAARRDLPPEVAGALARALAADPERRFPDIAQFAAAIDVAVDGGPRASGSLIVGGRRIPRRVVYGLLVLLPVAVTTYVLIRGPESSQPRSVSADTTRYAILPAETEGEAAARLNAQDQLHDAFAWWSGISLEDGFRVRDAVAQRAHSGPLSPRTARAVALGLGAGRYVRIRVTPVGDSLRVGASLYGLSSDTALAEDFVMVPASPAGADSDFARLADLLLLRGPPVEPEPRMTGTRSLPAKQAFYRGREAIQSWNLGRADTAFTLATSFDPEYAEADLWLALVRAWSDQMPARWQYLVEQALAGRASLSGRDQEMAEAIAAQGRGEFAVACARWSQITQLDPKDFVGWYGRAFCLKSDRTVVPDPSSPSGFRFRASYQAALNAYGRAFELSTPILASFRGGNYQTLRDLFYLGGTLRGGSRPGGDSYTYVAYPTWSGDTLGFVPYPRSGNQAAHLPEGDVASAVRHQSELFHRVAQTWAAASPLSFQAQEALALSLELLGDRAALDTIRGARRMARGTPAELGLAATEARLLLKYGMPEDTAALRQGVALAESLLAVSSDQDVVDADALVTLAALLGRADRAAGLFSQLAARKDWDIQRPLRQTAPLLLAYAGFGGPPDTLRRLEALTEQAISQAAPPSEQTGLETEWILRPGLVAFPSVRFSSLPSFRTLASGSSFATSYLLLAELAFAAGDSGKVREFLENIRQQRQQKPASHLTFDILYPGAWLLGSIGDTTAALNWLDAPLNTLAFASPPSRPDPLYVSSLVQAMALRAELAAGRHQPADARLWATAVAILWDTADPFLQPLVRRMRRLAEGR